VKGTLRVAGCGLRVEKRIVSAAPRLVIGAAQGRSGKTTVSLAVTRALVRRGLTVQCFKKGPDYIDPSWLHAASDRDCYNLDAFMMPADVITGSFAGRSAGTDLAMIEGAMGLFDGYSDDGKGTVAELARMLHAPIILVINAARMTRSVAAMVSGYQHFEPDTPIAGVILNNVSGTRHQEKLTRAIETHCAIPVLGAIPRDARLAISERHLGLVPSIEDPKAQSVLEAISAVAEPHLDLDGIMAIARKALPLAVETIRADEPHDVRCRIGVVRDRVFSFYYPENLQALQAAGAELVFIDSLSDTRLPDVEGLYIGGGFPELYAAELQANSGLRADIRARAEDGMAVYAECAGLMYLCRVLSWQGRRYEMAGVIPAEVEISQRPQGHGYVEMEATDENPLLEQGTVVKGHEFHHSRLVPLGSLKFGYSLRRGHGIDGTVDGVCYKNLFAAYTHLHALGTPAWAANFVALASRASGTQSGVSSRSVANFEIPNPKQYPMSKIQNAGLEFENLITRKRVPGYCLGFRYSVTRRRVPGICTRVCGL
jgi:cobyrinic acid a,c-diamide synthase